MLGFGFIITFDEAPIDFRSSWWLVPVAQSLIAAPFVVRIVTPALRVDRPASARGGRDARRLARRAAWREVDLPLVSRAFAVAAGFAFAIALGEFGATVFVARAEQPTLPVAIFRFLGRPGRDEPGDAAVLAVVLAGDHGLRGARGRAARRRPGPHALMAASLRVDGARVTLGGHAALAGVDLEVEQGDDGGRARAERQRQVDAARGRSPGCSGSTPGDVDARRPLARRRPAHRREIGLMFQDDALFPHRDVAANIAFGLRMQGLGRAERSSPGDGAARARRAPGPRATGRSRRSRAASGSASRSPARSRRRRACCCSTSRSARSTGRCTTGSWPSSGALRRDRADGRLRHPRRRGGVRARRRRGGDARGADRPGRDPGASSGPRRPTRGWRGSSGSRTSSRAARRRLVIRPEGVVFRPDPRGEAVVGRHPARRAARHALGALRRRPRDRLRRDGPRRRPRRGRASRVEIDPAAVIEVPTDLTPPRRVSPRRRRPQRRGEIVVVRSSSAVLVVQLELRLRLVPALAHGRPLSSSSLAAVAARTERERSMRV